MTKLDLLARAKALGITGRHDMTKADLETAVAQREMIQQVSDAAKDAAKEIQGKTARRRGSNLNTPWARKFYYVSLPAYEAAKTEGRVSKAPGQVQLLLKFMVETGVTEARQAQQGGSIASVAVTTGRVVTVIEPHVLFAYYRSKMEQLGLVFAGYDLDADEAEDMEAEAEAEAEAELDAQAEDEAETSENEGE